MASRLPITIRPADSEIAVSYMRRLATLHDMPFAELWQQASDQRRAYGKGRALSGDRLATIATQPRERLAQALIELRGPRPDWLALRHEPQRGCWRCNARHPGGLVLQLLGHHRYACVRHHVWIGPPDQPYHPQPSLDGLPEVVAAQHRHLRLLRRFGPAATFDAVLTGFLFCAHFWGTTHTAINASTARRHWSRRAALLIPPGTENDTFSPSRLFAATYPEAISIAELIGPLRWRRLAAGDPGEQHQFVVELGRRLGLADYRPTRADDPVAHWIARRCWEPPVLPRSDYRSERTFGGKAYRKPVTRAETARTQQASDFASQRNGSAILLHHRTLTEVRPRELTLKSTTTAPDSLAGLTLEERIALANADYVRPGPAPMTYLDTVTEPVPWPPRPLGWRVGRPWFSGAGGNNTGDAS
jgi:hypothetical protein